MKPLKKTLRDKFTGFVFVTPFILGFLLFTAIPLYNSIQYSFSKVRFMPTGVTMDPVGWDNFVNVLFQDSAFLLQLPEFLLNDMLLTVPMVLVFSVLLSLLLNVKLAGRRIFRSLFFLPVILMSGPVITNIMNSGGTKLQGVEKFFLYKFIEEVFPEAIASPVLYVFKNVILFLWLAGVPILIFLSGLQKVDKNIYEAAKVDGANGWQQFWKITMPTIKPFIFLNAIYVIVDISSNTSLNSIIQIIKEGMFQLMRGFGFSAALSWIYFFIILFIIGIAYLLFGRGEKKIKDPKPKKVKKVKVAKERG